MQLVFTLSEIAENQNHSNQNNGPPHGGYGIRDYLVLARDFGRELARWAIPAHIDELAPVFSRPTNASSRSNLTTKII